mmetsp:Transcript_59234/g.70677  ORF Transcript_59234/g.70677 Transcript_59234/m.70677 type:complete len:125 (+) Transcript_59234:158-532(+)|eukprot:CAMPEP_0172505452 /NCGR_PEP_ID=MMETSP1066-20121228/186634_1 /TAXON_ID=671091 /ORGANISM="Coscinodiscus wailesii, Strain CCMP2513" /LENGTH=124 /DNA_ID=CAMNT_0013282059 /DNA_START=149 /DNA_END=523 /DNA_ORIENTATION=+
MTYRSRGRSIFEVILAVMFVGFLVGFITVLCIGNYFRAKRAQERQRQRRLAKLAAAANNHAGREGSFGGTPRSTFSPTGSQTKTYSPESTFSPTGDGGSVGMGGGLGGYEAPPHIPSNVGGMRA